MPMASALMFLMLDVWWSNGVGSRRELGAGDFLEEKVFLGHLVEQLRGEYKRTTQGVNVCNSYRST